jgi:hypothetical protein
VTLSGDAFAFVKKLFIVSEELTRLSVEVKDLSRTVNNHEVRISVIENTVSIAQRSSKLTLPGN